MASKKNVRTRLKEALNKDSNEAENDDSDTEKEGARK